MAIGDEAFDSVLMAAKAGAEWAWSTIFRDLWDPVAGYLSAVWRRSTRERPGRSERD